MTNIPTTMRLDHIAMYVNDLEATKAFFTRYFGATSNEMSTTLGQG